MDFANVVGSDVYFEANFPNQRRKRQANMEKTGKITLAQFQAIVNDKIYPGETYLYLLENCLFALRWMEKNERNLFVYLNSARS